MCCVGEGRADGPFFVLAYLVTITELGTVIKSILMIMKTSLVCRTITRKQLVHFLPDRFKFLPHFSLACLSPSLESTLCLKLKNEHVSPCTQLNWLSTNRARNDRGFNSFTSQNDLGFTVAHGLATEQRSCPRTNRTVSLFEEGRPNIIVIHMCCSGY